MNIHQLVQKSMHTDTAWRRDKPTLIFYEKEGYILWSIFSCSKNLRAKFTNFTSTHNKCVCCSSVMVSEDIDMTYKQQEW